MINWTAPLEPSSVGRIALVVKTYGEMDPIQPSPDGESDGELEAYAAAPSAFLSREPPHEAAVPGRGRLFLGAVALAFHLIHQRRKAVGVRQLRRKVALSN